MDSEMVQSYGETAAKSLYDQEGTTECAKTALLALQDQVYFPIFLVHFMRQI